MKTKICQVCNSEINVDDYMCKICGAILEEDSLKEAQKEDHKNQLLSPLGIEIKKEETKKNIIPPPPWPSIKDKPKIIYFAPPESGFFNFLIYGLRAGSILKKQKKNLELILTELKKLKGYETELLFKIGKGAWEKESIIPGTENILKQVEIKLKDLVKESNIEPKSQKGKVEKELEKIDSEIKEYNEKLNILYRQLVPLESKVNHLKEEYEKKKKETLEKGHNLAQKLINIELEEAKDKLSRMEKQYNKLKREIETMESKIKEKSELKEIVKKEEALTQKRKLESYKADKTELINIFRELGKNICDRGIYLEEYREIMKRYEELKKIISDWERLRKEQQHSISLYSPKAVLKGWLYFWFIISIIIILIGILTIFLRHKL